jgi:hypothetical protein
MHTRINYKRECMVDGAGGQLACEDLSADVCAFAVSSAGRRCVLERTPDGAQRCQTSASAVGVETEACVRACGVDRAVLGLPIASAMAEGDRRSFSALCSSACRDVCPDVVDLYATVAAAEGACIAEYRTCKRASRVCIVDDFLTYGTALSGKPAGDGCRYVAAGAVRGAEQGWEPPHADFDDTPGRRSGG